MLDKIRELELRGDWRTRLFRYGFVVIAFETITGVYLFLVTNLAVWEMMFLLFHILLGFVFAIPCVMFLLRHRQYRRLFPDRRYSAVGFSTLAAMFFSLGSGVYLTFVGVSGHAVMWWAHIAASLLCVCGLAAYIWMTLRRFARYIPPERLSFLHRMVIKISLQVTTATVLIIVAVIGASFFYKEPDPRKTIPNYSYSLGTTNPFAPSVLKTSTGGFLKEELFLGSKSCGVSGCHVDTLKQWEDSVHYRSPNKISTVVENLLIRETKNDGLTRGYLQIDELREKLDGRETFRFCAACHAPVALLSGNVNPGQPQETFEKFEGVSCIACHSVTQTDVPGGSGFTIAPPRRYLFAHSKSKLGQFVHRTLINNKPSSHKNAFMKPFYRESLYCAMCHNRLHYLYWKSSPYNDKKNAQNTKHCQTCHMPQIPSGNDVSSAAKGTVTDHRTLAANMTVPLMYGLKEQYRLTERFLKDKIMALHIVAPKQVCAGKELEFVVRLANVKVGHIFPAGPEADLIEAWTEVVARTDTGQVLFRYGMLDAKGHLDDKRTYVYRVYPVGANGKPLELDRHRSWMFAEDRLHVISPMQYDETLFRFKVPPGVSLRRIRIQARLRFRKHNQHFVDWLVGDGKLKVPIVDLAQDDAEISVVGDSTLANKASKDWLERLDILPPELTGFQKKISFDTPVLGQVMALQDKIILNMAQEAFRRADYDKALGCLDRLSTTALRLPYIKKLRLAVEQSARERVD
ncbi:MAG: multiheme c-type cytochrome [Elusimicrobiota bacterium]